MTQAVFSDDQMVRFDDFFDAVVEERAYQMSKWDAATEGDRLNTSSDWLAYITKYAGNAYEYPFSVENFRTKMIKVAALALAAYEWCETEPKPVVDATKLRAVKAVQ